MEFNKLPSDIKQLIFNNNRAENNNINRDKKLAEFWDKWGEDDLEDELYDWYEEIKIYKFHQKRMEVHESAMCDGSAPDWFYTP